MLMTQISDMMDEEMAREIATIKTLDPKTESYTKAIEGLAKIYKERVGQYSTDLEDERQTIAASNEKEVNDEKNRLESERLKLDQDKLDLEKQRVEAEKAIETARDEIEKEKIQIEKERMELEKSKIEVDDRRRKHEKAESWTRVGMDIAGTILKSTVEVAAIVVPVLFYGEWIKEGLQFEEKGAFTSGTLRTFIGKLKPTRK